MKKLTYLKEIYEAERIVKTDTNIIGYNGKNEIFAFRGISDFSGFGVDGEFDIAVDELAVLRTANDELKSAILELSILVTNPE
ncbi:MAG: hypothetical protein ACQEXX_21295 [Bacillota bacterium]